MQSVFKANKLMVKATNPDHDNAYHRTFHHFVAQPNDEQLGAVSDLLASLTLDTIQAVSMTTTADIVANKEV